MTKFKNVTLLRLGLAAIAVRGTLQVFLDRTGRSNDFTDFAMGALLGAGIGLMMLFVWRDRPAARSGREC